MNPPSPSSGPVRFAYVGCGFVGQTIHIPNFASLPDCQFLALAEVRPELGREVAARYGIPKIYRSHEEIAADPDIEAVGEPDRLHSSFINGIKHLSCRFTPA